MKSRIKLIFLTIFLTIILLVAYLYITNKDYISSLQSIASDGISTANYKELSEIIKKLPITKKIFSVDQYSALYGSGNVEGIYKVQNSVSIDLSFKDKDNDLAKRSAVIYFNLPSETNVENYFLFAVLEAQGDIIGQGHQGSRALIELYDRNGKVMYGPHIPVLGGNNKTYLVLKPTVLEPIPVGSVEEGFDLEKVVKVAVRFVIGRYPDGVSVLPANGRIYLEDIYAVTNTRLISGLFRQPDSRRITQDTLNPAYQLRKLKWKTEKNEFLTGINYPWNNYGWDIGRNPYGQPLNSGWSANQDKLEDDFKFFKESGIDVVRIFFFCDLRTGLKYADGKVSGFDDYVMKDIESVFVAAQKANIKIMPVLFDFGVADGRGKDSGGGEHPELIFFSEKQNLMIYFLRPILEAMSAWNEKYGEPVFAVDLINEPENMALTLVPGYFGALKSWLKDVTNIIHNETSFKVTLGSYSLVDMQRWWKDVNIDIWQFHFYRYMTVEHKSHPFNLKRDDINLSGLVICGELEPYKIAENIQILKEKGYGGAFIWSWNSTDGFRLKSSEEYEELREWISKSKEKTGSVKKD